MKLGVVGPARGDIERLRALCERLLFDLGADRVVHLGADDTLDRAMAGWAERLGAPADDEAFYDEVAALAPDGPPSVLDALLERERRRTRLGDITNVPGGREGHVEMFEDRVVILVHERTALDDDDLTNATVVAHGSGARPEIRVVGARAFLSPGDASREGYVGVIEGVGEAIRLALYDDAGYLAREVTLAPAREARVEVRA